MNGPAPKRLTLFAGHYGSGKTNLALNWAAHLRRCGNRVTIADLDIVNPYFRTRDSEAALRELGIELLCSPFAGSNLDAPSLPKEIYALIAAREMLGVLDIGGDDRGALALGRWAAEIRREGDYEMLFVANRYRPLTQTPEDAAEILREIETAGGVPFTGVVNNSNLGGETVPETVLESIPYADALSHLTGLPVRMTSAVEPICRVLRGSVPNLFPLSIQPLYYQMQSEVRYGKTDLSGGAV